MDLRKLSLTATKLKKEEKESIIEEEINREIEDLLDQYFKYSESCYPPIRVELLAKIAGIKIKKCSGDISFEGTLLPNRDKFQLLVNKNLSLFRQRHVICHEIIHRIFYELTPEGIFKRKSGRSVSHREEAVCLEFARRLLIPQRCLDQQKQHLMQQNPLRAVQEVRLDYWATFHTVMNRLVRDEDLWPNVSLALWKKESNGILKPQTVVHGSKISNNLSKYAIRQAREETIPLILESLKKRICIKKKIFVGKRKKRNYMVEITPILSFNYSNRHIMSEKNSCGRALNAIYLL